MIEVSARAALATDTKGREGPGLRSAAMQQAAQPGRRSVGLASGPEPISNL
jgi:hypothetical protein